MSSDAMPDETDRARRQPPWKSVAFKNPIDSSEGPGQPNTSNSDDSPTPLAAALSVKAQHIAALHLGLRTFLDQLADKCLRSYATYFRNIAKYRELSLKDSPVPTSIKKIRLTLQPLEEVKESEDFMALQTKLNAETETLHRNWAKNYALVLDKMNCDAHLRRFHLTVCTLLHQEARGFIAQLGIPDYSEQKAVMDLLALRGNDILHSPLPMDLSTFLLLYKEANTLRILPLTTRNLTLNPTFNSTIIAINNIRASTTTLAKHETE
jgi:hypothetical protein